MSRKKKWPEPEIRLTGLQFKSVEKLRLLAKHLDVLEKEFGIREVDIVIDKCFICPDISPEELDTLNRTPMEQSIRRIVRSIRSKR